MRFFIALTALIVVLCPLSICATDVIDWSNAGEEFLRLQWAQFKNTYEKNYGCAEEEAVRFQNFQDNMARAHQLNLKSSSATFGVTQFADLSQAEFNRMYLGARPPTGEELSVLQALEVTADAPMVSPNADVDWRGKAVSAVKDQGSCGSCWAFSTVETVESAYFIKYGFDSTFQLSEQQVVDCDRAGTDPDEGCNGGWPYRAYSYVQKAGLESETAYPYKGVDGTCVYSAASVKAKITGWKYATPPCWRNDTCPNQDEQTLLNSLANLGPISICVDAEPWMVYAGGIFSQACDNTYDGIDHCVELVGYNSSQGGYWIARNSWGTSWGENGYIYLQFGKNICGIADQATIPSIA